MGFYVSEMNQVYRNKKCIFCDGRDMVVHNKHELRWTPAPNMSNGNYTYNMPQAPMPMGPMLRPQQLPMANLSVPQPGGATPQPPVPQPMLMQPQPMFGYRMQRPQVLSMSPMPPPPPMPDVLQPSPKGHNIQARTFIPIPDRRLYQRFGLDEQPPQMYAGYPASVMHSLSPYSQEMKAAKHGAGSPYSLHDMSTDLLPEYANQQGQSVELPEAAWTQSNDVYYFDQMINTLPAIPSTSKNLYHVRGLYHRNMVIPPQASNIADDQELEEELQALEQRICTEFKSAD